MIPDGGSGCELPGAPLNVTFNVTGITGAPTNVSVAMTFSPTHTWAGDVRVTLKAPNGASFLIFGNTGGVTGGGDSSALTGPYTFNDAATGSWATAATTAGFGVPIASGSYRTTAMGAGTATGAVTTMNPAFAGIPASNGTWTLEFLDDCLGDPGGVGSATLTLTGGTTPPPSTQAPNVDMNGDGASDYVIVRELSGSSFAEGAPRATSVRERLRQKLTAPKRLSPNAVPFEWWTLSSTGTFLGNLSWGDAETDWTISADFNGDDTDDYAIWRSTTPFGDNVGAFYWINSGSNTVGVEAFGFSTDDPTVVGDWDGDGIDDPASYRCPLPGDPAGPCTFYYKNSSNGTYSASAWGVGEAFDLSACPADYDGDGKQDLCIQREHPSAPGVGQFIIQNSGNGAVSFIDWGANTDFIIPGDYDGDGKSDIVVSRLVGGILNHYIRYANGTTAVVAWGGTGDVSAPGDYDGDGKQDVAIWRPSDGTFWVSKSSGGISATPWGLGSLGDSPLANWYVR